MPSKISINRLGSANPPSVMLKRDASRTDVSTTGKKGNVNTTQKETCRKPPKQSIPLPRAAINTTGVKKNPLLKDSSITR